MWPEDCARQVQRGGAGAEVAGELDGWRFQVPLVEEGGVALSALAFQLEHHTHPPPKRQKEPFRGSPQKHAPVMLGHVEAPACDTSK